ncbi:hypothetical protein F4776DRAFT_31727 [Hypoxylon sp. NC0597]|nr:hypothetical protein F4776DRAFT_31727 [Hypoxylon sp. NC0597]
MSRRSQRLPDWDVSPNHYDPNSGWRFAEIMDRRSVMLPDDSASQRPSHQRIAPQSPVLPRPADYHIHDPMYYRPTYSGRPLALSEQSEGRLHLRENGLREGEWEQPHTPERESLRGPANTIRSPMLSHRPMTPVHLCCGAHSPVEQPGSYTHNIPVMQTLPTFPHGLPVPYEPHVGDTASYRPLPSQGQGERTGAANPNPWNWTDAQERNNEHQATGPESTYAMESPRIKRAASPRAPLFVPEETQQQHVRDGATQQTALDRGPRFHNQNPPVLEGAMSGSSSGVYTPSSPCNSLTAWASTRNDMGSNLSTKTLIGDEGRDIEQPDAREDMDESQDTQARHTVDNTSAAYERRGNRSSNAEDLSEQRTRDFHVDMDPSQGRPQQQQPLSPPAICPATSNQREHTQLPETRDIAAEQPAENTQRFTITVEGDCYINLSSPNELHGMGELPLPMMPFLHVRGNLHIRTTAPRQVKRKRDESSEDDGEVDSNVGYEGDTEGPDGRPAKRR